MATNTLSSNFSSDVSTYIAQKVLSVALKNLVLYQLADKAVLPKNSSRTFQYTRYERVALPQSTLSEGVTPGDTSMSIAVVTAVMDQWGSRDPDLRRGDRLRQAPGSPAGPQPRGLAGG
jgi:N4-gp56 family major capsid protein